MREGFDNDKYIALQAEHIRERIDQFGGKLYLEFGGKLFDDYHASRVLPGFKPDTKISMLQSIPGIVFAYCGFGGAMTVFILTGFIKGIPYELEEAAAIDGCSPEGTFFRIIFPLLTPVITTVTILNGMWIWNDYLLPSLMLGQNGKVKTLPVAVQAFVGSYVKQWDLILTAALLAIVPMIVIFLVAQKQIMNGMVEGAIK